MRFIIMHRTNAHWEGGAVPDASLVARVSALLRELADAGALAAAEGLRPSSQGVRVRVKDGTKTVLKGPFERGNELPGGFSIVRAPTIDDAVEWATARVPTTEAGAELDIRPVTEPWDIGAAPPPSEVTTRRYMVLRKATRASEAGETPAVGSPMPEPAAPRAEHIVTETMRPSTRGRRYKNTTDGIVVFDGPFAESKELIGGYVIVSAASLDAVDGWARRYVGAVGAEEVDVRELA
jgi:hypothetical protein